MAQNFYSSALTDDSEFSLASSSIQASSGGKRSGHDQIFLATTQPAYEVERHVQKTSASAA